MKYLLPLIALILLIAVLCTACTGRHDPDTVIEEDGGVRDNTDHDAPTVIGSGEITSFSCMFSTIAYLEEDIRIESGIYHLEAALADGAVQGSYRFLTRDGEETAFAFQAETAFLNDLQKIVQEQDLAQYNGHSVFVNGLPNEYGASLQIGYASGESVYADDNQDCFLPIPAMEQLHQLFTAQAD